jgi:adenosylhomocysteine nucleosidase
MALKTIFRKKKMIYILVALKNELPEHNLDPNQYRVWYTGVGKVNAAMYATLAGAQTDCSAIVNYGTAGVLKKDLAGGLHIIGKVRQRDMDARPQAELGVTPFEETEVSGDIILGGKGPVLSTGDNFVTSTPELESDMVDMEGYAIAKVAAHMGKPVVLLKYGSDFADESAANDWEANQSNGAELFLEWIKNRG